MKVNWEKINNLIPAIVQDVNTLQVSMLGYMNPEALEKTQQTKQVTFYSRSKNCPWIKGETSGNNLKLLDICLDCDNDALLIKVIPNGPTCHFNTTSCFQSSTEEFSIMETIKKLEQTIEERKRIMPVNSYITALFKSGIERIAQKVGEEGVEVVIAALAQTSEHLIEESADLFFHLLVLLNAKDLNFEKVLHLLQQHLQQENKK